MAAGFNTAGGRGDDDRQGADGVARQADVAETLRRNWASSFPERGQQHKGQGEEATLSAAFQQGAKQTRPRRQDKTNSTAHQCDSRSCRRARIRHGWRPISRAPGPRDGGRRGPPYSSGPRRRRGPARLMTRRRSRSHRSGGKRLEGPQQPGSEPQQRQPRKASRRRGKPFAGPRGRTPPEVVNARDVGDQSESPAAARLSGGRLRAEEKAAKQSEIELATHSARSIPPRPGGLFCCESRHAISCEERKGGDTGSSEYRGGHWRRDALRRPSYTLRPQGRGEGLWPLDWRSTSVRGFPWGSTSRFVWGDRVNEEIPLTFPHFRDPWGHQAVWLSRLLL